MAKYKVTIFVEAARITTIQKEAEAAFGKEIRVEKVDLSRSRADRLSDVENQVQDCCSDVEELRNELQEWFDNLPEQFQSGDKGSELEEAIQALDEIKDNLDGVDFSSVSFPSMMG